MKLRDRLFVFSVAQLLVFGALFVVGYVGLERTVFPMLEDHLRIKAETGAAGLAAQVDVGLGADDRDMIREVADRLTRDHDLAYIEVRNARGAVMFQQGSPEPFAYAGAPMVAHHDDDADDVSAWADVKLEGLRLGDVAVGYSTARIDQLRAWSTGLASVIFVVWLAALAHSVFFARSFASPIRAMMVFSREVANGNFSDRLVVDAAGELHELKTHLNAMTSDLQSREAAQAAAATRAAQMQRELVSMSRMAGMAEIATGVLHNVGNVLNSLNVSVVVVGDELRASKVAALKKTVDLCGNHPGGLAGFLTTDKGKLLPQFLASLTEQLIAENAHTQAEVSSIVSNVAHIKAIVATQQAYAQVSATRETIQLAEIVDDALAMDQGSLARHGIELVKDYEPDLPQITSDRHRLLQIIVNLMTNARQAVEHGAAHKRLTVRLCRAGDGVSLAVADSGVGISADNLTRVFNHGFTTKRDGHGFGLHSSANAARELGGSLEAASDGPGSGATFTLALPRETPVRIHDRN